MSLLPNDIVLRPRFQLEPQGEKEALLAHFEKSDHPPFLIKRSDDHLFIKFNGDEINFWSPQLQLEIVEDHDHKTRIYGLFGPNPTLWTFFMFLHFGVATIFVILGIWAYSSAALDKPYALQVGLMALMVALWFALYAFGRLGKRKGRTQMEELHRFMTEELAKAGAAT
ncbi:GTP-binding protein [Maribacter sp. 2307ULW6-5]|uniref:GTP-binding protein n=1 Tax=Maribacter sp. 2307ULW6-5 TaxID=3386275 RepID=UPI0039BD5F0D